VEGKKARRAFFVIGPESSGTKMMAQILIRCGCKGSSGDNQLMADLNEAAKSECNIVVRFSFPHMRVWPDFEYTVNKYRQFGFEVIALVMSRSWWVMMESQTKRGHVKDQTAALSNIQRAYYLMFHQMDKAGVNFLIVSYEDLILNAAGGCISRLCGMLRLPNPDPFPEIRNENLKHYKEYLIGQIKEQVNESEASKEDPAVERKDDA